MRVVVLGAVLWLATGAQGAGSASKVPALVKEAERRYLAGDYAAAAELLVKAQAIEPNPRLVYDIARAYDQAGEADKALRYYQAYIGLRDGTDPPLVKRARLAEERLRRAPVQPTIQPDPEEQRQRALTQARERSAVESSRHAYDNALTKSYLLGGLAAAALTSGIVFGLSANAAKDQFSLASTVASKQGWKTTTAMRAGLADASFAVAAAAAVGVFFLYPRREPLTLSVAPQVGPGRAGLIAEVPF
jgi:tetratricopeptide (TPR) repeat protein